MANSVRIDEHTDNQIETIRDIIKEEEGFKPHKKQVVQSAVTKLFEEKKQDA